MLIFAFVLQFIFIFDAHTSKKIVMGNLGFQEILLIAVVVLVLFGGRKIPEFMRGLGRGVREFNDAKDNVKKELEDGMREKEVKASTPASTSTSNDYNEYLEWKKQQEMSATKEPAR